MKTFLILVFIGILVFAGVMFYQTKIATAPGADSLIVGDKDIVERQGAVDSEGEKESGPDLPPAGTNPKEFVVTYTEQGFSPEFLSIKKGDIVKFVNKTGGKMWVGSDVHPGHTAYSGTDLKTHCPDTSNTSFDQCTSGDEFIFTFNKLGNWDYHNHARSAHGGEIEVK
jgi:plastocyanin